MSAVCYVPYYLSRVCHVLCLSVKGLSCLGFCLSRVSYGTIGTIDNIGIQCLCPKTSF